ncbi:MAG: T9SS type A sorting domain-containing protein, partial [Bacteroidales bacterium]|nr:T9SS type A sorting domain-containing protein [Bacteroidales bacterium]MCF8344833.1 T9SS type A sorting domain-containing protein [Bacteroidales bacterium]MCF8377042.1 T9SS type A sorting domain-containing protein [Bacteroidales bacterium]MCF8400916.1 T9SS type A sorting domain-containing protein [Bacteroidales bacterium]
SDCVVWTDTEEIPTPEEYYSKLKTIPIKAYPNPANNKINFALENTDKHKNIKLECYDIFGRQLHEQKIYTGQLEAEADVSKWGKGIYVVVVKSNGKVVEKTKFVVE